jgi:hypothetical protein
MYIFAVLIGAGSTLFGQNQTQRLISLTDLDPQKQVLLSFPKTLSKRRFGACWKKEVGKTGGWVLNNCYCIRELGLGPPPNPLETPPRPIGPIYPQIHTPKCGGGGGGWGTIIWAQCARARAVEQIFEWSY